MLKSSFAVLALVSSFALGADPAPMFRAADVGGGAARPLETTVLRARAIEPDLAAMQLVEPGARSTVRLGLFDDADFLVSVDRADVRDLFSYTWYGRVVGGAEVGGTYVLSVEEDAVMGAVWLDDARAFEIKSDAAGVLWATEIHQTAFEPCATGHEHCVHAPHPPGEARPEPVGGARGGACQDDGSLIDVMVVYTPSARNAAGGTNAVRALANSAVASANTAYQNSNIATRLRLVYLDEISYAEGDSFSQDLSRLRSTSDGLMDEVHAIRNTVKADMVALINNNSGACGVAYLMTNLSTGFRTSAFSVTRHSCAVGNLTFAHELGHNMGSAHDRDNSGNALFSYSYGHRWTGTNGTLYRSVMAYSPGSRRSQFSNPDVLFVGTPTGVPEGQPNSADNARSINLAAFTIANFTGSVDANAPVVLLDPQSQQADVGDNVVLTSGAGGSEPLSYRWQRDGEDLDNGERISGAFTPTLVIEDVRASDAGAYRVVVSNDCGSANSDPADLVVLGSDCPADIALPFGELNFFDLSVFLSWYNQQDPRADLAAPAGVFNFFDVAAYLGLYNAGCP
jgi:hypothetical protein